jgi:hypothetical protein
MLRSTAALDGQGSRRWQGVIGCQPRSAGGGRRQTTRPHHDRGKNERDRQFSVGRALMDHTSGRPVRGWGLARSRPARLICATFLCCTVFSFTSAAAQRLDGSEETLVPSIAPDDRPEPPGRVEVQPVAQDGEIRQRIANILKTTGWFREPKVTVQEGIVFLKGTTGNDESKQWAGDLAKNTEGVVAVVNQIVVSPTTVWDFAPTFHVLNDLTRLFVRSLPLIVVAGVVIFISWLIARLTMFALRRGLLAQTRSQLLREVTARVTVHGKKLILEDLRGLG